MRPFKISAQFSLTMFSYANDLSSSFGFIAAIGALHIERLVVPGAAKQGDDLQLSCYYHLEDGENLYALRWYKDEKEFFRYMPKETPAQRVFNASGVRINASCTTFVLFVDSCNGTRSVEAIWKHFSRRSEAFCPPVIVCRWKYTGRINFPWVAFCRLV